MTEKMREIDNEYHRNALIPKWLKIKEFEQGLIASNAYSAFCSVYALDLIDFRKILIEIVVARE